MRLSVVGHRPRGDVESVRRFCIAVTSTDNAVRESSVTWVSGTTYHRSAAILLEAQRHLRKQVLDTRHRLIRERGAAERNGIKPELHKVGAHEPQEVAQLRLQRRWQRGEVQAPGLPAARCAGPTAMRYAMGTRAKRLRRLVIVLGTVVRGALAGHSHLEEHTHDGVTQQ